MSNKRKHDAFLDAQQKVDKKKRTYTKDTRNLASIYERLTDESNEVRIQAAQDLLRDLEPQNLSDKSKNIEDALRRLIRGLCSGRKAARFGFFVAFTELLRALYGKESKYNVEDLPSIAQTLETIETLTHPEGNASGQVKLNFISTVANLVNLRQEKRDHLFGRVSAYKAVIQSSILHDSSGRVDLFIELLNKVFTLARDVSWLRQECGMMLCEVVKDLDSSNYANTILDKLIEYGLARTPEGVAIWLAIRSQGLDVTYPPKIWHKNDPLHRKEMKNLAAILKESRHSSHSQDDDLQPLAKTGVWNANANFAWGRVLDAVLIQCSGPSPNIEYFRKFWIHIIDENLFTQSSSSERKFWGLQIFSRMIMSAPDWALPAIFSPILMRCIINQRVDNQRTLFDAAAEPFKKIHARARREPRLASIFVSSLSTDNGVILFDRATKTKAVEELLTVADDDAMLEIVHLFGTLFSQPQVDDDRSAESTRQGLADLLLNAARNRIKQDSKDIAATSTSAWLSQTVHIFSLFAYCIPAPATTSTLPNPPMSQKSRSIFQSRLSSLMAHLMSSENVTIWPEIAVDHVRSRTQSADQWRLACSPDSTIAELLDMTYRNLSRIRKTKSSQAIEAFKLLLSLSTLQVFGGDPDAVSILEELNDPTILRSLDGEDKESGVDEIVEVLLSFVSRPSALFRKIADQVFSAITPFVTERTLQSLFEVLVKKENLGGQEELFDQQDTSDIKGDDDTEMDSDVDVKSIDGSKSDSETGGGSARGSDDGDEAEDAELERLDTLLAEALKTTRPSDRPEGGDNSSEDESDMDDDQMMAIEPHLAKIFQERRAASTTSKKKEQHEAKANMIHFKTRVLDLLGTYLKQEYNNSLSLQVILPLLRLRRWTSSPQLANKASDILKSLFDTCSKKKSTPVPQDIERAWLLLQEIHQEALQQASKQHDTICSRASLLIVRSLINLDRSNYHRALTIYTETQNAWFKDPKVKLQPQFFTEWVSWTTEMRKVK